MKTSDTSATEHAAIDQLIEHFFAVFDNRRGKQPDFALLDGIFLDHGMIYKRDATGVEAMDLAAFKAPRIELFKSGQLQDFHEWETAEKTVIELGLAARFSSYQKAGILHAAVYQGRGIKHFQLVKTKTGWKISSMTWEDFE